MAKLFVAVLLFSTVSLAAGHQGFNLDVFFKNPKIKLLSNPDVKGAYPGDDTNYDDLFKALAELQDPFTAGEVKDILHEHAPALYNRVQAARQSFVKVRDNIKNAEDPWEFLVEVGLFLEKYYLVGLRINEQAKHAEDLHQLYDWLSDEAKKVADEKLKEAAEVVEKALYNPVP